MSVYSTYMYIIYLLYLEQRRTVRHSRVGPGADPGGEEQALRRHRLPGGCRGGHTRVPKEVRARIYKTKRHIYFCFFVVKKNTSKKRVFFVSSYKSTRKKNIFLFVLFCNSNPWKLSNKDILLDKKTFKLLYAQKLYFCILCICIIKSLKGFCNF